MAVGYENMTDDQILRIVAKHEAETLFGGFDDE